MVSTTPQRLGGGRRWLVCPSCRRRRAVLFAATDPDAALRCRACWGLTYATQYEHVAGRLYARAFAPYDRIGVNYRVHPRQRGPKPKGMHWRTYWRLLALAQRYDAAAVGASGLAFFEADSPLARDCAVLLASVRKPDAAGGNRPT